MFDIALKENLTPAVCEKMLEKGINKIDFIAVVKTFIGVSDKDFALITGVSQRTLSRLKPEQNIPPRTAEVTLSVLRIYQKATEIFGNAELAQKWMKRPNTALNGRTPFESLNNRFGAEEVLDVLTRLEYGVYS